MLRSLVNFVLFQLGWFACILGAAAGRPWLGPAAVAVILAGQLAGRSSWRPELSLCVAAAGLGLIFDGAALAAGAIAFPPQAELVAPVPLWMLAMWSNLAATLPFSLRWLVPRYGLAAILGAAGGPLAYVAGARLGAIELGGPTALALAIVAAEWAIAMPLLVLTAGRIGPAKQAGAAEAVA